LSAQADPKNWSHIAMSENYIGQIIMGGFNFAPAGYAFCNGQLMSINQNSTLFNLIGTTYGGDGQNTFALPNLQSQLPVHQGSGGGSAYVIGQTGGVANITLNQQQIPSHSHTFAATTATATTNAIAPNSLLATPAVANAALYAVSQSAPNPALVAQQLALGSCGNAGGSQPHSNLMPSLCITFCISLFGVFPSQS
jgi:microcystin-dependent protein